MRSWLVAARTLRAGIELRDDLASLGYGLEVRLGRTSLWRYAVQLVLFPAWLVHWWFVRPAGMDDAFIIAAAVLGTFVLCTNAVITLVRSRFTLRERGLEVDGRGLIPWESIRSAQLVGGDLVVEHDEGGRARTERAFVGRPFAWWARWGPSDGRSAFWHRGPR